MKKKTHDETNFVWQRSCAIQSISTNGELDDEFSKHEHQSDIIFIM